MTAGLDGPVGEIPAGLPDEATLTRMAAEFFGALGGSSATPGSAPPGGATAVPSGGVSPGTVPADAPSESAAAAGPFAPTPAAPATPSSPLVPEPPRVDLPGLGGGSTTAPAQYANTAASFGEFTPPWLLAHPHPGEAAGFGGAALPGSAVAPGPPAASGPRAGGSSTTAANQYDMAPASGATPSYGNPSYGNPSYGNPFGDYPVVVPTLPEVPGLDLLGGSSPAPTALAPAALLPAALAPGHGAGPHSPLDHLSGAPSGSTGFVPEFPSPFAGTDVEVPALPSIPGLSALAAPSIPGAPPISVPSTPYAFLGESSGYPASTGVPLHSVAERPSGGRPQPEPGRGEFDVEAVRRDFPILHETVNGRPLVWFDNAATTQKPQAVIDRLGYFYAHENSNIHRAAHELAARSTDAYEGARDKVARFLGAGSASEIVFVRGATEAINLVAAGWGRRHIRAGDEIVISHLEHHANIVPWQELVKQTGAVLKVIPVDSDGQILMQDYTDLLSDRTKLVAVTQVSNALGTVVPVKQVADLAHRAGACVLVDGAQSVPHMRVDVQDLGADFFVFSGHKIFAPTGIGALYGREEVLEDMGPYQTGGNMIRDVTLERSLFNPAPMKFEAGTGNIADAVGLGAALDYLERIGFENAARYEHSLLEYGMAALREVPGLTLIGTAPDKASVMSFVLDGYTPEQVGNALNREGIAVRSGHHCAQPILRRFGLEATVRPSLAFYNTCAEIDHLVNVLHRLAGDGGSATRGRNRGAATSDPAP